MNEQNSSDLQGLVRVLPEPIQQALEQASNRGDLLEIVARGGRAGHSGSPTVTAAALVVGYRAR